MHNNMDDASKIGQTQRPHNVYKYQNITLYTWK